MANPMVPATYDILWSTVVVVCVVLLLVSVRSVAREPGLTQGQRLVWTAVVVLLPVVGCLAWFSTTAPSRSISAAEDPTGVEWHSRRALR